MDWAICILLFITSIILYLILTEGFRSPNISPDGTQYLQIANNIIDNQPILWIRPPGYPLLIILAKTFLTTQTPNMEIVYFQYLTSALTPVITYLLTKKLTLKTSVSFGISLLVIFNLQFIGYANTVLTESIVITLVMLLMFLFVNWIEKPSKNIFLYLFLSLSIISYFIKPIFLYLPFCYLILGFIYQSLNGHLNKNFFKKIYISVLALSIPILSWCSFNYLKRGFFSFDQVTVINKLGKSIQYGYLRTYPIKGNDNSEIREIKNLYLKGNTYLGPLVEEALNIDDIFTSDYKLLEDINSKISDNKHLDFTKRTLRLYPEVLESIRNTSFFKGNRDLTILKITEEIWNMSSAFSFFSITIAISTVFIIFFKKSYNQQFIILSTLLLTYLYFTSISTIAGFSEYSRLISPIAIINLIFFFLSFYFIYKCFKTLYIRIITKNKKFLNNHPIFSTKTSRKKC